MGRTDTSRQLSDDNRGAPARVATDRAGLLWVAWALGPATYAMTVLAHLASVRGPIMGTLLIGTVIANLASAALGLVLLGLPGRHRGRAEFRLLVLYWISTGAVFAMLMWAILSFDPPQQPIAGGYALFLVCIWTSFILAASMPFVAMTRSD